MAPADHAARPTKRFLITTVTRFALSCALILRWNQARLSFRLNGIFHKSSTTSKLKKSGNAFGKWRATKTTSLMLAITSYTTSHICHSSFYEMDPTRSKRFIMPVFTAANCCVKKMVSGRANFDARSMAGVGTLMDHSRTFHANGISNIRKLTMHVCRFPKSRLVTGADLSLSIPTPKPNLSKISLATCLITSPCFPTKSATSRHTLPRSCAVTGRSHKRHFLRHTTSSQPTHKFLVGSATAIPSTTSSAITRGQSHHKDLRVHTCKVCPSFHQLRAWASTPNFVIH